MPEKRTVFSPTIGAVPQVNSSVDQVESGRDEAAVPAPARLSPHTITGVNYGWASRLRSFLFIDPLIWFYTVFLGMVALTAGIADRSGRRMLWFSRVWSWLYFNTILSPVIG